MEIITGIERRRWSAAEKLRIVAETERADGYDRSHAAL
jgi:hypothetical protein